MPRPSASKAVPGPAGAMFHGAPAPTPKIIRPPVSTSSEVTVLTRTPGWR